MLTLCIFLNIASSSNKNDLRAKQFTRMKIKIQMKKITVKCTLSVLSLWLELENSAVSFDTQA